MMFPQLIAGPIVRYVQIEAQLRERRMSVAGWDEGIRRFVLGFCKKVLIADTLGVVADSIFAQPVTQVNTPLIWCAVLAYTLQIYYDFSGYSDMAIGLGRIFGFTYPENFKHPYVARSIRDFWRRWHITLSTFFRDYVYIPLGGNRHGEWRTCRNLLVVFMLCGLWHGASWSFLVWGLFHGVFLMLERGLFGRLMTGSPRFFQHCYTMLVVMVGWVFFRVENFGDALRTVGLLFGIGQAPYALNPVPLYVSDLVVWVYLAGILFAAPIRQWLKDRVPPALREHWAGVALARCGVLAGFFCGVAWLTANGYTPFLYFRF